MPPKQRITRDMVIDAAFIIARECGIESVNARSVAEKLSCSTQPVMYHFRSIEELKAAVLQKTDDYHTGYLMNPISDDPMLGIGLNYIRFAATEKQLFRLLFQSDKLPSKRITDLINPESIAPILEVLCQETQVSMEQSQRIFLTLALFTHGYASLLANNSLEYNEEKIAKQLSDAFEGAVCAAQADESQQ